MQFYSLTDKGKYRSNNEDFCLAEKVGEYTLLILADGMGGANGGEIASKTAVETVQAHIVEKLKNSPSLAQIPRILSSAIEKANTQIYNLSKSDINYKGMGTTLDICIVSGKSVYIAHIGDSRVYKVTSAGEITRLTKDHSLVEYMIETGALTPEEALNHPQKNIITRALGTTTSTEADIINRPFEESDFLLMCSDGLSNMLDEKSIAEIISGNLSPSEKATSLIDLANDAGGTDNITVILAQI